MKYNVVQSSMRKRNKYSSDTDLRPVELLEDDEGMFTTQLEYPYAQSATASDDNDYEIQQEYNGLQPKNL